MRKVRTVEDWNNFVADIVAYIGGDKVAYFKLSDANNDWHNTIKIETINYDDCDEIKNIEVNGTPITYWYDRFTYDNGFDFNIEGVAKYDWL